MRGRKLTFEMFLLRKTKSLTKTKSTLLDEITKNMNDEAFPYAHLFYSLKNREKRFISYCKKNGTCLNDYPTLCKQGESLKKLACEYPNYASIYEEYESYIKVNAANNSEKKMYYSMFKALIKDGEYELRQLCQTTDIDRGNLSGFLQGELSRLSIKKCELLKDFLTSKADSQGAGQQNSSVCNFYN